MLFRLCDQINFYRLRTTTLPKYILEFGILFRFCLQLLKFIESSDLDLIFLDMLSRPQKPTPRDFLLMHAQTRAHLCTEQEIFDPCEQLYELTSFEKTTLLSWYADSNVDKGLNLYILLHYLSAINNNSCYYHYVNNGNPDGTNMFGHIIGTSG
jgi:hypothetical protein